MKRLLAASTVLAIALTSCAHVTPAIPFSAQGQRHSAVFRGVIDESSLWQRLSQFQRIADAHEVDGHGTRDTGTPGYKASVAYVAGLMRKAGYTVTIQSYPYETLNVTGTPRFGTASRSYTYERDWFVARGSASGSVTAPVVPSAGDGCAAADFSQFPHGDIALVPNGGCASDVQVMNAAAAGARAVVIYTAVGPPHPARLNAPAKIPVIGVAAPFVGADLLREFQSGTAPAGTISVRLHPTSGIDYNLIADSPYGDPNRLVAIDAHLDSIFGAGMLDNASGSTTILEIALNLAKTHTKNRLRYIWFGGEELGLLGSHYYTTNLSPAELHRFLFDVDVDVTATPNYDILIADPANAYNVQQFPSNVVPQSQVGNDDFADYFTKAGIVSRNAKFGNDGTDSNSFALAGVPDSGILTEQDCCKATWETQLWGGFLGNYEGNIPSYDGGCVDMPNRWCDNLSNNDPFILDLVSNAVANVTISLANDTSLKP